jgi:hypothetical protein
MGPVTALPLRPRSTHPPNGALPLRAAGSPFAAPPILFKIHEVHRLGWACVIKVGEIMRLEPPRSPQGDRISSHNEGR